MKIKKAVKHTSKVKEPEFMIVRWEIMGHESTRTLIDLNNLCFWSAGINHEESVAELERYKTWSKRYPETFEFIAESHIKVVTDKDRTRIRKIIDAITHDPFVYIDGDLIMYYEPIDTKLMKDVAAIQQEYVKQRADELKNAKLQEEQQRTEKTRNEALSRFKSLIKNRK